MRTVFPSNVLYDIFHGYVECALWTTSCNGMADHSNCNGDDCDSSLLYLNYDITCLTSAARDQMLSDLKSFLSSALEIDSEIFDGLDPSQIGHDFWLTRNGHGAGFWDRGLGARGETLSDLSRPYGECELYVDILDMVAI